MNTEIVMPEVSPAVYVLLLAYDEEQGIGRRLEGIQAAMERRGLKYAVAVVNDGSTDRTKDVVQSYAERMPLHLLNHESNRGVGTAFRTGFSWLARTINDDDVIICMEADNTHSIKTIDFMLHKLNTGYEVVTASGWAEGGMLIGLPFVRWLTTMVCNKLYRLLFPIPGITCYTGFYRAYRGNVIKLAYERFGECLIESEGFACMAELLVKLRLIPVFCAEVPLLVRYDVKQGRSKMRMLRTVREHLEVIARFVFKRRIV